MYQMEQLLLEKVQYSETTSIEYSTNDNLDNTVQTCEVSSTSPFIRQNFSLYQQLTQTNRKECDPPSSPTEKMSIQDKWTKYPSPFPPKKHNINRLGATVDVSKLLKCRSNFGPQKRAQPPRSSPPQRSVRTKRKNVDIPEVQKSQVFWQKWLSSASISSGHETDNLAKTVPPTVVKTVNQDGNLCSGLDHSIQRKIKGKKQRITLEATCSELNQEVKALRSIIDKLKVSNVNMLCDNEQLQTLIEIKSAKTCVDFTTVTELLSKTILRKPEDMGRYMRDRQYSEQSLLPQETELLDDSGDSSSSSTISTASCDGMEESNSLNDFTWNLFENTTIKQKNR